MSIDMEKHPCFNGKARHEYARVHLPVAPRCNIKCGFCNRKYDCANETRPGVTSSVLTPEQAVKWLDKIVELKPNTTVVGIAGPGDPFANPAETMSTLRLVREKYPDMLLCVASNGLGIAPYVKELAELEVSHVTITMCAPDANTGAKIYEWVNDNNIVRRGEDGAALLFQRQLEAIKLVSEAGIMVKVNCILVPGYNDEKVLEVARLSKDNGASLFNLMPLYPVEGTKFSDIIEPSPQMLESLRKKAGELLPQMRHCMRCRADAVGLIGEDMCQEIALELKEVKKMPAENETEKTEDISDRPYVAVASREGSLVNLHLGEAPYVWIFGRKEDGEFYPVERRQTPPKGMGSNRWFELAKMLSDCRALLCSGIGDSPREVLEQFSVKPIMMEGLIEDALVAIYEGREVRSPKRFMGCGKECAGGGTGCA